MSVITKLSDLFFSLISNVYNGAWWLVALLVTAFLGAVVFNIIHEMLGGR
jgi:Mg/Co/Ni transporter MgtE